MITDLNFLIDKVGGSIEDVKAEALKRVIPLLVKSTGENTIEQAKESGYHPYRAICTPLFRVNPPFEECIWIGKVSDEEGNRLAGGLFREDAYRSGYRIVTSMQMIPGNMGVHVNSRAEIYPISRDELIDLLYENLMTKREG